jgi:UPF0042 nucleotide-binding protein
VALVMDARGGAFTTDVSELSTALDQLRSQDINLRVLFLEASDEVLIRRFEATRRRHPVAGERVAESIALERNLLRELRAAADLVLDTSDLNVHELRSKILAAFADEAAGLLVTVASFGFKYGLPLDADMVVDVRFLPNPHWVPELRPLKGTDPAVRDYVLAQSDTGLFLARLEALLETALPGYVQEGKHYLTVAVGCTGGKHRSVVLAEELASWLTDKGYRAAHRAWSAVSVALGRHRAARLTALRLLGSGSRRRWWPWPRRRLLGPARAPGSHRATAGPRSPSPTRRRGPRLFRRRFERGDLAGHNLGGGPGALADLKGEVHGRARGRPWLGSTGGCCRPPWSQCALRPGRRHPPHRGSGVAGHRRVESVWLNRATRRPGRRQAVRGRPGPARPKAAYLGGPACSFPPARPLSRTPAHRLHLQPRGRSRETTGFAPGPTWPHLAPPEPAGGAVATLSGPGRGRRRPGAGGLRRAGGGRGPRRAGRRRPHRHPRRRPSGHRPQGADLASR